MGRRVWIAINLLMFKVASWNIRGLNSAGKQHEARDLIHCNGIHLCVILETHVKCDLLPTICSRTSGRWSWVSNHAVLEYGTCIIVAWDVNYIDVMLLEVHA